MPVCEQEESETEMGRSPIVPEACPDPIGDDSKPCASRPFTATDVDRFIPVPTTSGLDTGVKGLLAHQDGLAQPVANVRPSHDAGKVLDHKVVRRVVCFGHGMSTGLIDAMAIGLRDFDRITGS